MCYNFTYGLVTLHMAHMTRSMVAIKTPSPYRRSLWMVCIWYVDGTVGIRQLYAVQS
jgi:hypothetical protein